MLPEIPKQDDGRWEQIAELWRLHARLRESGPYLWNPAAWEEFQGKLLRLEQLAASGSSYESEFAATRQDVEVLANNLAHGATGAVAAGLQPGACSPLAKTPRRE